VNAPRLSERSSTRLAVVNLRHRIELVAVNVVAASFPQHSISTKQTHIRQKLAFILVAHTGKISEPELIGMLRMARHIYKRTSDVLHGRSSMVNLSPVLLAEWETFVERLEDLERPVSSS